MIMELFDELELTPDGQTQVKISLEEAGLQGARIKVVGVGGGGGNAINHMVDQGLNGAEFIAINTDLQALRNSKAPVRLQVGVNLTKGLGAGANPDVGRQAAMEDADKIMEMLEGADMVFITGGMGGGTATGAAPVIASFAHEMGALTVAVVTKPFSFEAKQRMRQAEEGLKELRTCVDSIIVIPNDKLITTVDRSMTFRDACAKADDVLRHAVQSISDLILSPGLINLDFADVRTIMKGMGKTVMGTGIASGDSRALDAAEKAINSPLLEEASVDGARGILLNISASSNLTMYEVDQACKLIHQCAHEDATIIFGTTISESLGENIKVTVIATGFEQPVELASAPTLKTIINKNEAAAVSAPHQENVSFYRKSSAAGTGSGAFSFDSDDLDIPAFKRKL
jgi:cell division protein FtsZ